MPFNGTIVGSGSSFVAAKFGNGFSTGVAQSYVTFPAPAWQFGATADWSVEFQIKITESGLHVLLGLVAGNFAAGSWVFYNNSGVAQVQIAGFNGGTEFGTKTINDGAFHHLRLVVTGGTSASLCVDGVLDVTKTGTYVAPSGTVNATLGAYRPTPGSPSAYVVGTYDELAIFNVALPTTFTPPVAPYADNTAHLTSIYHMESDLSDTLQVSTVNFGYADAGIGQSFASDDGQGHHALLIETVAAGTDCVLRLLANSAGTVYANVDGGGETTIGTYTNTGTNADFTIFAALTEGNHDLTIRITGTGGLDATRFLRVTGSSPILTVPARFGTSRYLNGPAYMQSDGVTFGQGPAGNGGIPIDAAAGTPMKRNPSIRFRATITSLRLMGYRNGSGDATCKLLRRNPGSREAWTEIGDCGLGAITDTNVWHFGTAITGLDGTQAWEYQIVFCGAAAFYLLGISCAGTGIDTTTLASQGYVQFWGDSITQGYLLDNQAENFVFKVCRDLGLTGCNAGLPGEQLIDSITRMSGLGAAQPTRPLTLVLLIGVNDTGANACPEPTGDRTVFTANATTFLATAAAQYAGLRALVLGLTPSTAHATHPNSNAAWTQAVATQPFDTFATTSGWIDPDTETADGLHPTDAGDTKIAAKIGALLAPMLYDGGIVAAVQNGNAADVTWTPIAGAVHYVILRAATDPTTTTPTWTQIGRVAAPAITFTDTAPTQPSYYDVVPTFS